MDEPQRRQWLINKRGYYYRPNRSGYTASWYEAGRYTEAEARKEASIEPDIMMAVHQDEVRPITAPCPTCGSPRRENERLRWDLESAHRNARKERANG